MGGGNRCGGLGLGVEGVACDVGIISDLVEPGFAAGVFFGGNTTFSIFDEAGVLLGEEYFNATGPNFLGFVSDVPIGFTLNTENSTAEAINSFLFVPVPEHGTLALLALAGLAVIRRR